MSGLEFSGHFFGKKIHVLFNETLELIIGIEGRNGQKYNNLYVYFSEKTKGCIRVHNSTFTEEDEE